MHIGRQLSRSQDIAAKVSTLFQKRVKVAQANFAERMQKAVDQNLTALFANPVAAANICPE